MVHYSHLNNVKWRELIEGCPSLFLVWNNCYGSTNSQIHLWTLLCRFGSSLIPLTPNSHKLSIPLGNCRSINKEMRKNTFMSVDVFCLSYLIRCLPLEIISPPHDGSSGFCNRSSQPCVGSMMFIKVSVGQRSAKKKSFIFVWRMIGHIF